MVNVTITGHVNGQPATIVGEMTHTETGNPIQLPEVPAGSPEHPTAPPAPTPSH